MKIVARMPERACSPGPGPACTPRPRAIAATQDGVEDLAEVDDEKDEYGSGPDGTTAMTDDGRRSGDANACPLQENGHGIEEASCRLSRSSRSVIECLDDAGPA